MIKVLQFGTSLWVCLLAIVWSGCGGSPLDEILTEAGPTVSMVMQDPEAYDVQIIYVQIDRDADNHPVFTPYQYRLDPRKYFYPASTAKLPVAVLAIEKLHEMAIPGLDRNARMRIDSARHPQTAMLVDTTSRTGLPSVGHFVTQVFTVSDNAANNRLYEFLGQEEIHRRLRRRGFRHTRILHRLGAPEFSASDNRYTNPVSFYHADTLVYEQPEHGAVAYLELREPSGQRKGRGYYDTDGLLAAEPFDFSEKNFFPLDEQVDMLKAIMFPETLPDSLRFCLGPEDYNFLRASMGLLPRECPSPRYDTAEYYDSYVKFLMFGDRRGRIPPEIRIFNKVGWAYGTMTDCAYIVDFDKRVEYILAATILVNADGIFNDDAYEYETVGLPFFGELGRAVYAYELQRKRERIPDLSGLEKSIAEYSSGNQ